MSLITDTPFLEDYAAEVNPMSRVQQFQPVSTAQQDSTGFQGFMRVHQQRAWGTQTIQTMEGAAGRCDSETSSTDGGGSIFRGGARCQLSWVEQVFTARCPFFEIGVILKTMLSDRLPSQRRKGAEPLRLDLRVSAPPRQKALRRPSSYIIGEDPPCGGPFSSLWLAWQL